MVFTITYRSKPRRGHYTDFYGSERYPTDADKAAAFFYYIIKNHPATDGNNGSRSSGWKSFASRTV